MLTYSFSLSLSSPTHCCLISHRHCVDHSESVLCVHSAYLFHSHQQTHTSMWMDHVGFSWSVTLTFNSNDTIFKTFHNKQKDVILLGCLHCLHYFSNCLIDFQVLLGDPRNLQPNLVSAQRMRKCRCQSRRCVNIRSGKKKSEGDRGKRRDRGRKRHIRVWIDYEL